MSTIEGQTFCDARDRAAMLARAPAPFVPCEACGAEKGEPCKCVAQRSAPETPPPWTEAHRREATRRTFELAAGLAEADRAVDASWIAINVLHMTRSEADWRLSLGLPRDRGGQPPLDAARIDREVAIVRERAERPCLVCHEVGFHKMSCYPQNREDARRRRGQADTLTLIRAQKAGALRADELASLMTRLEWIFASEDASQQQCQRCGGLRGVVCGACAGAGCEACGGDGDLPCPTCNPRGDAGMSTPDGMHPVARAHQEVIRERDAAEREVGATTRDLNRAHEEIDDLRAQLAATQELLRVARPVVAAADALADAIDADPFDRSTTQVLAVRAAVIAARENRAQPPGAPAWIPPPGVAVEVLHGSVDGPLLIALVTLEPGAKVPAEVHHCQEEMFLPVSGRIEVGHHAGRTHVRTWFPIDPGVTHTVRNESKTETATYLAVLRRVSSADAEPATVRREEEP